MTIKKLWKLSGYDIPEEAQDKCCKKTGILAGIGKAVGLGGAKEEGEHDEHKDLYAYLDTKEMAPYKGWENIPYALLKCMVDSPYIWALLKHDLLKWEFQGKKKQYTESRYLGAMGGFVGEFIRLQ